MLSIISPSLYDLASGLLGLWARAEMQRARRKQRLILKWARETSHFLNPTAERNLGQTYLLILKSHLERQAATGAHPGDREAVADISESSPYSNNTGTIKYYSGFMPLAY